MLYAVAMNPLKKKEFLRRIWKLWKMLDPAASSQLEVLSFLFPHNCLRRLCQLKAINWQYQFMTYPPFPLSLSPSFSTCLHLKSHTPRYIFRSCLYIQRSSV